MPDKAAWADHPWWERLLLATQISSPATQGGRDRCTIIYTDRATPSRSLLGRRGPQLLAQPLNADLLPGGVSLFHLDGIAGKGIEPAFVDPAGLVLHLLQDGDAFGRRRTQVEVRVQPLALNLESARHVPAAAPDLVVDDAKEPLER